MPDPVFPCPACGLPKKGETYLLCRACWRSAPSELRGELRAAYRNIWTPKRGRWMARARLELGRDEFMRRVRAFKDCQRRVIQAAESRRPA